MVVSWHYIIILLLCVSWFLYPRSLLLLHYSIIISLEVCGLLTPLHIVPEWYFLCQYAMLKAISKRLRIEPWPRIENDDASRNWELVNGFSISQWQVNDLKSKEKYHHRRFRKDENVQWKDQIIPAWWWIAMRKPTHRFNRWTSIKALLFFLSFRNRMKKRYRQRTVSIHVWSISQHL